MGVNNLHLRSSHHNVRVRVSVSGRDRHGRWSTLTFSVMDEGPTGFADCMALHRPALLAYQMDLADWLPLIRATLSCGLGQPPKNRMVQTVNVLLLKGNLEGCKHKGELMTAGQQSQHHGTLCLPSSRLKSVCKCWQGLIQVIPNSYLHLPLDNCLLLLILIFSWQVKTTFFVSLFPLNVHFPYRLGKATHVELWSHRTDTLRF